MLLVGGVLVVSGIVLTRTVKHRLEEENRERADQTVAYAADRLEAGVAVDSVFATSAAPGDVFMVLRLADGTVIASQQPVPFTIPIGATESAVAGSAGAKFTSEMAVPPPGAQIVTRVVDLPQGESVLVGVSPLDDVRASVSTLVNALWWGSPVLVLLVGLIAWLLVGRALRPVEQLRATVETISRSTLEQRVDVPPSHDEVARLATTMNTMLERLQRSRDHERRFVSDASHELRSPLASIRAQLEVGDAIDTGATDTDAIRAGVLADTIRLERIVGDLMELARSDETTARPNGSVALDVVVADEITALQRSSPIQITSAGIDDTVVRGRPMPSPASPATCSTTPSATPKVRSTSASTMRTGGPSSPSTTTGLACRSKPSSGSSTASPASTSPVIGRPAASVSASPSCAPWSSTTAARSAAPAPRSVGRGSPSASQPPETPVLSASDGPWFI